MSCDTFNRMPTQVTDQTLELLSSILTHQHIDLADHLPTERSVKWYSSKKIHADPCIETIGLVRVSNIDDKMLNQLSVIKKLKHLEDTEKI